MTGPRFFLGIDGGGTKTEFVCMDETGVVRGRARTGPTYHPQIGVEGVARALSEGLAGACAEASIGRDDAAFAFIGLPAFGEDSTIDPQLEARCAAILGHDRFRCGNDMVCGWAGSLACCDGINLVAGTGSIGYGKRGEREARVGGWGETFSDEGSAHWIAIQGLNAFTRMSDGRMARGPLYDLMRRTLSLELDLDLCAHTMSGGGLGRDGVAALAPIVVEAEAQGDRAAAAILASAIDELAAIATTLRTALSYPDGARARISWSGGVLRQSGPVRDGLRARLAASNLFDAVAPQWSPVEGAARYAAILAGAAIVSEGDGDYAAATDMA